MRRMPIPYRRSFPLHAMRRGGLRGIRPNFSGLFPCRGQVAYVLLTSAPVAIRSVATPMLPLDLHVLSLSLAFILSQDQTLRCVLSSLLFLLQKMTPSTSTAVPLLSATPHWPRLTRRPSPAGAALAGRDVYLHLSLRNLDCGELRGILASLSLTCLSDFLIANMSMISQRLPGRSSALLTRRQKNRSTRTGSS